MPLLKEKISLGFTEPELVLLIQLLVEKIVERGHSGISTNDLPETVLNMKLLNARAETVGDKPIVLEREKQ